MNRFVPIQYRDFWDVPRIFLVDHKGHLFLFDCPFDDVVEDYATEYRIYVLPTLDPTELTGSWAGLSKKAERFLRKVPIGRVCFDPSKRKEMDSELLEELVLQVSKPKQAIGLSSL